MSESFKEFTKRIKPPKREIPTKDDYLKADESYAANLDIKELKKEIEKEKEAERQEKRLDSAIQSLRESSRFKKQLATKIMDETMIFASLNGMLSDDYLRQQLDQNSSKKIRDIADEIFQKTTQDFKSQEQTVIPPAMAQEFDKLIKWKLILIRSDKPEHGSKFAFPQAVEEAEKNIKEIESRYIA